MAEVSASWDDLAKRSGIADLSRNAVLGKPFWDLAPDEESRLTLRGLLGHLARGQINQAHHSLELTDGTKPLPLQLTLHPIRDGEQGVGFLVQAVDHTAERAARMALLDRERKLRELRGSSEHLSARIAELEIRLSQSGEALHGKDDELAGLREQHAALLEQLADWNTEREEIERRIADLQSENTLLRDEVQEAKRQADESGERVAELLLRQESDSEQVARWTTQSDEQRERMNALLTEKTRLEDDVIERERQLRVVRLQTDELRRRIGDLEGNCETLEVVHRDRENRSRQRAALRDQSLADVLQSFRRSPEHFPEEFCRLAALCANALFATLAVYAAESKRFSYVAQHGAPDVHQYMIDNRVVELTLGEGPAGIAAERGCPTKFDHLLERADFTKWAPLAEQNGYNCIWALPLADEEGIFGVLQVYYADEDVNLSVETLDQLNSLIQLVLPLLRACDAWPMNGEAAPQAGLPTEREDGFRMLAAELAEEFGNLLTGV
ncbi:MAG: hypothetical protein PHI18_01640, partial [bacterium]|nr:hypothetical protein [bacterium]